MNYLALTEICLDLEQVILVSYHSQNSAIIFTFGTQMDYSETELGNRTQKQNSETELRNRIQKTELRNNELQTYTFIYIHFLMVHLGMTRMNASPSPTPIKTWIHHM